LAFSSYSLSREPPQPRALFKSNTVAFESIKEEAPEAARGRERGETTRTERRSGETPQRTMRANADTQTPPPLA